MHPILRLAAAGAAAVAATALAAAPASAHEPHRHGDDGGPAVFVQTDAVGGNAVVAYHRAADGRLRQAARYPTLGRGGVLGGSVVDHLASQGALQYDREHRLLYVVNAGSDSLTVFRVHGTELRRLQVIGTGGSFPVSIAVRGRLLYVLNARAGGSVQGFVRTDDGRLARMWSWHRDLGLDAAATPEFTHTPGQVSISPDGRALLVTTKAGSNAVDVFRLWRSGAPAQQATVTSLPGTVPFAVDYDRAGHVVLVEAGTDAVATFTLRGDGRLVPLDTAATGQQGSCWIVTVHDAVYISNAGSATLSGYRLGHRGALAPLGTTATGAGTVDAAATADGRYLYVQTGAAGGVDAFRVHRDGSLGPIGSVLVPGAAGAEGIAAG